MRVAIGLGEMRMIDEERDQFVADVFDVIVETGAWRAVLARLEQRGYTEEQVDEGFMEVAVVAGRTVSAG